MSKKRRPEVGDVWLYIGGHGDEDENTWKIVAFDSAHTVTLKRSTDNYVSNRYNIKIFEDKRLWRYIPRLDSDPEPQPDTIEVIEI